MLLKIPQTVVVEGKYDKIRLTSVIDAHIITCDGFRIFKQEEKAVLLRRLAQERGLLVLTDPDGGGKVIRAHLKSILPREGVTHLYIPAVAGKEKRKPHASKEGLLGVEGIDADRLRVVFAPFAVDAPPRGEFPPLTKADFYADGLSGGEGSASLRAALCRALDLPPNLSANALLEAINLLGLAPAYRAFLAKREEQPS